jgi:hypothetical protein
MNLTNPIENLKVLEYIQVVRIDRNVLGRATRMYEDDGEDNEDDGRR